MCTDIITIWHENEWVNIFKGYADKVGLTEDQKIDCPDKFIQIIHENIAYGVMMMKLIAPLKYQQN